MKVFNHSGCKTSEIILDLLFGAVLLDRLISEVMLKFLVSFLRFSPIDLLQFSQCRQIGKYKKF